MFSRQWMSELIYWFHKKFKRRCTFDCFRILLEIFPPINYSSAFGFQIYSSGWNAPAKTPWEIARDHAGSFCLTNFHFFIFYYFINSVFFQLFWACGTFILIAAAAIIIPTYGWRYLTGFIAVLSWVCLFFFKVSHLKVLFFPVMTGWCFRIVQMIPESPRYLLGKGRHSSALRQLQEIARVNKGVLPEGHLILPPSVSFFMDDHLLLYHDFFLVFLQQEQGNISDMFSPSYLRLTIQLFLNWFCMAFGYYGVVLGSTEIVERARVCDIAGTWIIQR